MKHRVKIYCIILISSFCTSLTREIRTPLPTRYGPFYKLFPYRKSEAEHRKIQLWATAFRRKANEAYCKKSCNPSDCSSKNCPLSKLIFGKTPFLGSEAFSPASIEQNEQSDPVFNGDGTNRRLKTNLFLDNSSLCPNIEFKDQGAMLGMYAWHHINECLRIGTRITLPIRSFAVDITPPCDPNKSCLGGDNLNTVLIEKTENIDGNSINSFAYRLDFLSMLPRYCTLTPANQFPVVNYRDASFNNTFPITMSNQDVTDNQNLEAGSRNPVTTIKTNGSQPIGQLALPIAIAQSLPALPANGQSNNERSRFVQGTDYTPLGIDQSTQETLWVVPTVDDAQLVSPAQVIQDNINALLPCIPGCTEQFFEECDICLAPQKLNGIGDLDTNLIIQYQPSDRVYMQGCFGVRFPTGKKVDNAQTPFLQPLGNNGHYELKWGGRVSFKPWERLIINTDYYFNLVLNKTELVATPFADATVKNLGLCVPAKVRWNYFLSHYDALFSFCEKPFIGLDVGYVVYAKGTDTIKLCKQTAVDCLGNRESLNARLLENLTHVVMHKIRTELVIDSLDRFETVELGLFGGYSLVVGGTNVPKDRGFHIGLSLMF
ncbi:MAG: hypothetical protein WD055_00410 [Candidatus Dependentiae bacterium]